MCNMQKIVVLSLFSGFVSCFVVVGGGVFSPSSDLLFVLSRCVTSGTGTLKPKAADFSGHSVQHSIFI